MIRRFAVLPLLLLAASVAWLQVLPAPELQPSALMPPGALLTIEANDFHQLLQDWTESSTRTAWLQSANYRIFQQSNLLQKMTGVYGEYASAGGFAPDLSDLLQIAGARSAIALYNPRELQFLYITKLPNARFIQSKLWALHANFETRESAGKPFYFRTNGQRTAAFAVSGDYLLLSTRDDLIASALALQSGASAPKLSGERWYSSAAAAHAPGDLRMVLNLAALVKNTYFRSYWIERNISGLAPYLSEVSDIDRTGANFTERRVLIRQLDAPATPPTESARQALARLAENVPLDASLFRAWVNPDPNQVSAMIASKILFPHVDTAPDWRLAPAEPEEEIAGSEADLETRIDEPALPGEPAAQTQNALNVLLAAQGLQSVIEIQSTHLPSNSSFVSMAAAIGIIAERSWDVTAVRDALSASLSPRVSVGNAGLEWIPAQTNNQTVFRLNGLATLALTATGNKLYIANSEPLLDSVISGTPTALTSTTATYLATVRLDRERPSYVALMRALDSVSGAAPASFALANGPSFFSSNVGSLLDVLTEVHTIHIDQQSLENQMVETVQYR